MRAFCRGRCRSQPFATKERYGCGSAACRYTSARWEVANFPKTTIKSGAFCRADVGIGLYGHAGKCIRIRRRFSIIRCILPGGAEPRPYQLRLHFNGFCVKQTVYGLKLMTLGARDSFHVVVSRRFLDNHNILW